MLKLLRHSTGMIVLGIMCASLMSPHVQAAQNNKKPAKTAVQKAEEPARKTTKLKPLPSIAENRDRYKPLDLMYWNTVMDLHRTASIFGPEKFSQRTGIDYQKFLNLDLALRKSYLVLWAASHAKSKRDLLYAAKVLKPEAASTLKLDNAFVAEDFVNSQKSILDEVIADPARKVRLSALIQNCRVNISPYDMASETYTLTLDATTFNLCGFGMQSSLNGSDSTWMNIEVKYPFEVQNNYVPVVPMFSTEIDRGYSPILSITKKIPKEQARKIEEILSKDSYRSLPIIIYGTVIESEQPHSAALSVDAVEVYYRERITNPYGPTIPLIFIDGPELTPQPN